MNNLFHRFTEASTWAALAAAFTALAVGAPSEVAQYMWYPMALCTVLGVLTKEAPKQ